MDVPLETFRSVLRELFGEAYTGPNQTYTWFIDNKPDSGILGTLSGLSAEDAARKGPTGSTIAAHTEHLRWSLALANAFTRGENPTPSWAESWTITAVDASVWDTLCADLRRPAPRVRGGFSGARATGRFFWPADTHWHHGARATRRLSFGCGSAVGECPVNGARLVGPLVSNPQQPSPASPLREFHV